MRLDKHPVLRQAYELRRSIEQGDASIRLTHILVQASELGDEVEKLIDAHTAEVAQLRTENERYRKALELVKHDIDADDHPRAWGAAFEALRASVL